MKTKLWRRLRNMLAVALVGWLAWRLYDRELWGTWGHVKAAWLICAMASTAVMLGLRCAKWHWLLMEDQLSQGRCESARSLFGAYALASVTPGRLGDFGRCMFMGEGRRARALLFTLVDKLFDLWAVASLAVASLFLFAPVGVAVAVMAGWIALIPVSVRAKGWMRRDTNSPKWLRRLHEIWSAVEQIPVRRFAVLAAGVCVLDMFTLFCLIHAFHSVHFRVAFATYPWLVIAGSLPISLGGVGPREGLSALLLPLFSIPAAVAVNVSLVFFALTALVPAVLGAGWMAVNPPALGHRWWSALRNPASAPVENQAPAA
ncbi:MAG TPA: lysylphosphatidylglycerol synthase transmembrane domain-containing protein [Terriglobia bacterium]|nr:lysylphosphatidylglycerol synthase transmembrane domain-containing protein [Terriglobia bacterium]